MPAGRPGSSRHGSDVDGGQFSATSSSKLFSLQKTSWKLLPSAQQNGSNGCFCEIHRNLFAEAAAQPPDSIPVYMMCKIQKGWQDRCFLLRAGECQWREPRSALRLGSVLGRDRLFRGRRSPSRSQVQNRDTRRKGQGASEHVQSPRMPFQHRN